MASRIAGLVLAVAVLIAAGVAQSDTGPSSTSTPQAKPAIKYVPATFTDPSSGEGMYMAYCASCHGKDAKGDGPAAPALKAYPTNLRLLAAKNGGKFPDTHVAQVIKGDAIPAAHGSREMPVWGPVFLRMDRHEAALLQLRVHNLTTYIDSLQLK